MEALLPVVAGVLFAAGIYLMLRRTLGQLIIGLAIIGNAANLLIFAAGRLSTEGTAIVPPGSEVPVEGSADPVPQALILTAIVIGFGILAFFILLVFRAYRATGTDDLEDYSTTDRLSYGEPEIPLELPSGAKPLEDL